MRASARTSLTTGVASCVMLLPAAGCRPSADLASPEDRRGTSGPGSTSAQGCKPCEAAKPPPGSPDDHEPPAILGARFVARDRLQLTFSEPLASPAGVNPRQFRLSRAYSSVYGSDERGYASGYYYDLGGQDTYEPPLVVVELEQYEERPEVLALILNRPVPIEVCEQLVQAKADLAVDASDPTKQRRGQVGLFLHYTTRGSAGIRDRVDNPLADIGADWALNFGARHKQLYGTEPVMRLDLLPEIPCPDGSLKAVGGPPGPS
ncbi:MAG: hypothetical protein R6X02_05350 [Enhygromyxa sp.]